MDRFSLTSQETLEKIARHCPSSMSAYLQCLNRADKDGTIVFTRKLVEEDMSEHFSRFKNQIKKLALEGLLEWHPLGDAISVTIANSDEGGEDEYA